MNKPLLIVLGAVVVLIGAAFGGRAYATRAMSNRAVNPEPLGATTPASVGLPFTRVAIENDDRTLIGWWVRAPADSGRTAPAILFLHGNSSDISDYVGLQRFFQRHGISSLVFDYSGFGASGGSPSLSNAVEDAGRVAAVFADSAGAAARKVAIGAALGATVLLQAIDSIQPHVNGIVIEGVTASVREAAVRDGHIPRFVAPLLVDVADNVEAAANVRVPVLAIHSYADNRFPFEDATRVIEAVPSQSSLVKHWRKGHSSLLTSTRTCDWEPVLAFVRTGALPSAKIDSTNACAVQPAPPAATPRTTAAPRPPATSRRR